MRKTLLLSLIVLAGINLNAQRYIIRFKNKGFSPYSLSSPSAYLSSRAIERRQRFGISVDSTDLPVTPRYIDSLLSVPGVTVLNSSRWLNQVSIQINDLNALIKINSFSFVQVSSRIASRMQTTEMPAASLLNNETYAASEAMGLSQTAGALGNFFNYGNSVRQITMHNGQFLHNIGLRGQSMIIGMLDAGFQNYTTLNSIDSARINGQILGTWDFVDGNTSVAEDHPHGMHCFSVIAANIPGTFVGSAPKANFYLFKTEDAASEYPIEEHNWVCGAERVDSAGGDLISSSLGYYVFDDPSYNHSYSDLDGNTTIIAKGTDIAAKKGLMVVQAAGNSGADWWHYILTPADADSNLVVGAVNADTIVAGFSSYGPSADGQVKPDVTSVGWGTIMQFAWGPIGGGSGTSFACPNMAGLVTCLMQGFPEVNNMKLISAIRKASHKYGTPDDRMGYGVPDMKQALVSLLKEQVSANGTISNCSAKIKWVSKDMSAMKYEIERKTESDADFKKIGEVSGTGSVFSKHSYEFNDNLNNQAAGIISYRIKQWIDTASSTSTSFYIDTINADLGIACNLESVITITPNPAKNNFVLQVNIPEKMNDLTIRITDAKGMVVKVFQKTKAAGRDNINLPIPSLLAGQYFVSVYNNGILIATKTLIKAE